MNNNSPLYNTTGVEPCMTYSFQSANCSPQPLAPLTFAMVAMVAMVAVNETKDHESLQ